MKNLDNLFSTELPHESAEKHVSGMANYTDDIIEPKGTLHAAIGWSTIAKGRIIKLNLNDVIKSEGVCGIVTKKDIPGINDVGPVFKGDYIFSNKKIEYFGQPIFAVAATSTKLARKAVLKAKVTYKTLKPVIDIKEVNTVKSF